MMFADQSRGGVDGIARFTLLGTMLARVFAGDGFLSIALIVR